MGTSLSCYIQAPPPPTHDYSIVWRLWPGLKPLTVGSHWSYKWSNLCETEYKCVKWETALNNTLRNETISWTVLIKMKLKKSQWQNCNPGQWPLFNENTMLSKLFRTFVPSPKKYTTMLNKWCTLLKELEPSKLSTNEFESSQSQLSPNTLL